MKKVILFIFIIALGVGGFFGWKYYSLYNAGNELNLTIGAGEKQTVMFNNEMPFSELGAYLEAEGIINNAATFNRVVEHKERTKEILKPGLQTLDGDWDNKTLVNQLFLAKDKGEVEVTFNSVRLKEELADKISANVQASSAEVLELLNDEDFCQRYGFNTYTIMTLFLPDTYQLKWETTAEELVARMATEYKNFWTDERKQQANNLGLSQSEVSILASIVQAEQSSVVSEQPRIAGLYLNRIRIGMPLQSDPTLIFALNDFTIKRVLNVHKEVKSPYNTYQNLGLPPGPINLPEKHSLESVLNAESNDYLYMCAKPKGEGHHNFAVNYNQHLVYARAYQKWIREYQRQNN